MSEDGLVKVHVKLPNHWAIGGESFWAKEIGNELYTIENVPFFAYGLNFKDVVRAIPDPDGILQIEKVVKRSGNKTMRARFSDELSKEKQIKYLDQLKKQKCSIERSDRSNVAINVKHEGDFQEIYDQLEEWANKEILDFETAQERVEGSFDDLAE